MADSPGFDVTAILRRVASGNDAAAAELLPVIYEELHRLAAAYLRGERADHTLQTTALVHEAYVKLVDQTRAEFADQRHFMAVAARAMRQILVDHARRRRSAKRGGDAVRIPLDEALSPAPERGVDLAALDDALAALEKFDARKSRVVELRFFGGMTNQEAAVLLGVSPKTTEADWYFARAWLRRALSEESAS